MATKTMNKNKNERINLQSDGDLASVGGLQAVGVRFVLEQDVVAHARVALRQHHQVVGITLHGRVKIRMVCFFGCFSTDKN